MKMDGYFENVIKHLSLRWNDPTHGSRNLRENQKTFLALAVACETKKALAPLYQLSCLKAINESLHKSLVAFDLQILNSCSFVFCIGEALKVEAIWRR